MIRTTSTTSSRRPSTKSGAPPRPRRRSKARLTQRGRKSDKTDRVDRFVLSFLAQTSSAGPHASGGASASSFKLDVGLGDDLAPLLGVGLDQLAEFLLGQRHHGELLIGKLLDDRRIAP